jgi:hypothetical protein
MDVTGPHLHAVSAGQFLVLNLDSELASFRLTSWVIRMGFLVLVLAHGECPLCSLMR